MVSLVPSITNIIQMNIGSPIDSQAILNLLQSVQGLALYACPLVFNWLDCTMHYALSWPVYSSPKMM